MPHAILSIAALVALASPWAGAQTVYRCGSSYSQQPCAGGTAIETPPPPSPTDRAQAASVAAADAKRADAMQKARLELEKNAPKAVVPASAPTVVAAGKGGTKAKAGKLEQFTAVSPGPKKSKKKKSPGKSD